MTCIINKALGSFASHFHTPENYIFVSARNFCKEISGSCWAAITTVGYGFHPPPAGLQERRGERPLFCLPGGEGRWYYRSPEFSRQGRKYFKMPFPHSANRAARRCASTTGKAIFERFIACIPIHNTWSPAELLLKHFTESGDCSDGIQHG